MPAAPDNGLSGRRLSEATLRSVLGRLNLSEGENDHVAYTWAHRNGFRTEERPLFDTPMWNGRTFNGELPGRHLLHDIAHWIIAPPERQALPDFGLGSGPESVPGLHVLVPNGHQTIEELRAALLGVLLQDALGLPCGDMLEELGYLSTSGGVPFLDCDAFEQLAEPFAWLLSEGHIDEHGFPKIMDATPRLPVDPDAEATGMFPAP